MEKLLNQARKNLKPNPKDFLLTALPRVFLSGWIVGFFVFFTFTHYAQAGNGCGGGNFLISSITTSAGACAAAGSSISVTITFTSVGTNQKVNYAIGFLGSANDLSSNSTWFPAGDSCPGSDSNTYYTSPNGTNTITEVQTLTVPTVGYTIQDIVVNARDTADGNKLHCDATDGSCTQTNAFPFTICAGNTPTFTPTFTPTKTNTPTTPTFTPTITNTPFGGPPTNTFTPAPTNTSTNTPTPTITNTSTTTNTPTITYTPTPYLCNPIPGATAKNLQGGTACFNNQYGLLDASSVFGMSLSDVKNLADFTGTSLGTPVTLNIQSDWKLSYFTGNLTYDPSFNAPYNRLHAFGILVVDGNLDLRPGTGSTLPSSYGGVVFVTGNLTIEDGCEIDGAVIIGTGSGAVAGNYYNGTSSGPTNGGLPQVLLTGSAGNYGTLFYSPSLVTTAQTLVGQYREDVSQRRTMLAVPNL
jgi:hypothetical protein